MRLPGRSVRQELIELCAESARGLGFEPVVRFDGPIDTAVDTGLADDLFAVTREALTNVAKHARATAAEVAVGVRDGMLDVRVVDDGVGVPTTVSSGSRGIGNLRARAHKLGGSFELSARSIGGTALLWRVPLPST